MAALRVGELRRSNLVSTYGPGAIADFRAPDGGVVSVVIAGLNLWDQVSSQGQGLNHSQVIHDPRLQRRLNKQGFRLPPVEAETLFGRMHRTRHNFVPAFRFPDWMQCPRCHRIGHEESWGKATVADALGRFCTECTPPTRGSRRQYCVPIRFVMACPAGHLQDFPWHRWVGHRPDCRNRHPHSQLRLENRGPGLGNLYVRCDVCQAESNLRGIFKRELIQQRGITCEGHSPWLGRNHRNPDCSQQPSVLQRGASNLYFPIIETALAIPPFSDGLAEDLGQAWAPLQTILEKAPDLFDLQCDVQPGVRAFLQSRGWTPKDLAEALTSQTHFLSSSTGDLKAEEYRVLVRQDWQDRDFRTEQVRLPSILRDVCDRLVLLHRLREVRALRAFTRLIPPDPESGGGPLAQLSARSLDWLPAVENRGEGFFLTLAMDRLCAWEQRPAVLARAQLLDQAYRDDWAVRHPGRPVPRVISPRFLLVHTLAHALMRQLANECGYSAASIRERLYVQEGETGMAGLLIYTASPDADGTLGGLVRQARPERVADWVPRAIRDLEWCASDPLCITADAPQLIQDTHNLAACHACVLAPETACTEFNRLLDRAMLVGLPDQPDLGFFADWLTR